MVLFTMVLLTVSACGQKTAADNAKTDPEGTVSDSAGAAGTPGGAENAGAAGDTGADGAEAAPTLEEQLRLAWDFLTEGNYREAVLAFTAVIDIDPKNGDAYRGRAEAYLGQAGSAMEPDSAMDNGLTFSDYVNLAEADYKMAEENGADREELLAARRESYNALFLASLGAGEEALSQGDDEAMFAAMRQTLILKPYTVGDVEAGERYNRFWMACTEHVQESREPERIQSYTEFLIDLAEQVELPGGESQDAVGALNSMLTGYGPDIVFTQDYIEEIDRPIVEFARRHEDLAEDNVSLANILWRGSIALKDLDTARRMFPIKNLHTRYPEGYEVREDGYTINKDDHTQEYDFADRLLSTTIRWPSGATTVNTCEYESDGPRRLAEHSVTSGAGNTSSYDRSYTYADGQLVSIHTAGVSSPGKSYTKDEQFHYSGWDIDIEVTYSDGSGETELRKADYEGSYGPR